MERFHERDEPADRTMRDFSRTAMVKPLGKSVISELKIGEILVFNETLVENRAHGNKLSRPDRDGLLAGRLRIAFVVI